MGSIAEGGEMNYPKTGVDMDGVSSNYVLSYSKLLVQSSGHNYFDWSKSDGQPVWDDWNMDLKVGYSKEDRMKAKGMIEKDNFFWLQLEAYVGVREALNRLIRITDNLYFITDRSGNSAKVQTELWLSKMGVPNPTVLISAKKGDIVGALGLDYYLDDSASNCHDVVLRGAKTFIQNRPWNINLELGSNSIIRVDSLGEFVTYVQTDSNR